MTSVVLEEIPDRVSLAVDISNCRGNCEGCHSPFLKKDIGRELTPEVIDALVKDNFGVNCFLFLGEGRDPETLLELADHVRQLGLQAAVYSGREEVEGMMDKLPVITFIGQWIYCYLYGTILASVMSRYIFLQKLFGGNFPPRDHDAPDEQ